MKLSRKPRAQGHAHYRAVSTFISFLGGSVNWFFLELVGTSVTSMQALEGNSGLTLTSGRPNSSDALLTT